MENDITFYIITTLVNVFRYYICVLHYLKIYSIFLTLFRPYLNIYTFIYCYAITWWNSLSKQKQNRVNRTCYQACKVIGLPVSSPGDMYVKMSLSKVNNIIKNKDHLLHHYYNFMRSGKRLRCISSRTQHFRKSFVQWFYSIVCDLYVHVP